MAEQLAGRARQHGFDALGYLLEMAAVEAEQAARDADKAEELPPKKVAISGA